MLCARLCRALQQDCWGRRGLKTNDACADSGEVACWRGSSLDHERRSSLRPADVWRGRAPGQPVDFHAHRDDLPVPSRVMCTPNQFRCQQHRLPGHCGSSSEASKAIVALGNVPIYNRRFLRPVTCLMVILIVHMRVRDTLSLN